MKRNYWLDLFTGTTWEEFLKAGANISGFRDSRWSTVQKIKTGDYLICYLTGVSRFIGILEVVDKPFKDNSTIWKDEDFPSRLKVKVDRNINAKYRYSSAYFTRPIKLFSRFKKSSRLDWSFPFFSLKMVIEDGEAVIKQYWMLKKIQSNAQLIRRN